MMLSTSQKIRIARSLSTVVIAARGALGLDPDVLVTRRGIRWSLDLKEGIDFAIYLLGGFEIRTLRRYGKIIKHGDTVLDIGANIGAHTLPLALLVGSPGKVYSFEPTAFAYAKQLRNIALNPALASRIVASQMMLLARHSDPLPDSVYSSWPLETATDLHSDHHGRLMGTSGSVKGTLDDFIARSGIARVDFMKIDVDGNEGDVLAGAVATIGSNKPRIMLELAPYVYGANPAGFDELLESLWHWGYRISDMATQRVLPRNIAAVRSSIPDAGGLNVLAEHEDAR